MDMIILDTNAVIYYLQNDKKAVQTIDKIRKKENLGISTITEIEIFSFPNLTEIQQLSITKWLEEITIFPVDSFLSRQAARLRRIYKIKTPDAIIASTAIFYNAKLITRDKDFKKIKELDILAC